MTMRALFAASAFAMLATASAVAQDGARMSPLPRHLPLGVEACFGRSYDAAHLARHPRQRVASFHVFRDFTPDPTQETEPETAAQMRQDDGTEGRVNVSAYVRFRDKPGVFWNLLSCSRQGKDGAFCAIDCDGGSFNLKAAGDDLLLENKGFVVVGGCDASEDESAQPEFVKPGADDRTFRLQRQPVAACVQQREAHKPAWAKLGPPIRARISTDAAVCFVAEYDAAHLASHPGQTVQRVAVLKRPRAAGDTRDALSPELVFRFDLKDRRKLENTSFCAPDSYAYTCPAKSGDKEFMLTRAGAEHIMLRDKHGALAAFLGAKLGADDRTFRLKAMPASACEP
jgi:hypothetical protein